MNCQTWFLTMGLQFLHLSWWYLLRGILSKLLQPLSSLSCKASNWKGATEQIVGWVWLPRLINLLIVEDFMAHSTTWISTPEYQWDSLPYLSQIYYKKKNSWQMFVLVNLFFLLIGIYYIANVNKLIYNSLRKQYYLLVAWSVRSLEKW